MYGMWLGIPLGFVVFVAGIRFLPDYFHEWVIGWALAACGALAIYNVCRGIDVLNDQKLDNPPPFDSKEAMPLVFGKIHELLKEAQYGPWAWQVRTVDTDEMRLVAVLKFTEISGGYFEQGRVQLERLVMLNVQCEQVEIEETTPLVQAAQTGQPTSKKIPGTMIQLRWAIDSPVHRHQVNDLIRILTAEIQDATGVKAMERKPAPHPMMPPAWLQATAASLLVLGLMNHERVEQQIAERTKAIEDQRQQQQAERERLERERQDQIAAYKQKMEDQRKQWEQQQQQNIQQQEQQGYGLSKNNPFAPSLGGAGNPFAQQLGPSTNNSGSLFHVPDWAKKQNDYGSVTPGVNSGWQSNTPTGGLGQPGGLDDNTNRVNSGPYTQNGNRWRAGGN